MRLGRRYRHWRRAVDLAVEHNIEVQPRPRGAQSPGYAYRRDRMVLTAPIDCDEALATFAHEVGHVMTPRAPREIDDEMNAWKWAIYALDWRWNQAMEMYMADCLRSYDAPPLAIDAAGAVSAAVQAAVKRRVVRIRR